MLEPNDNLQGREMKPVCKCQKQFMKWALKASSKNESVPTDLHVKMLKFTADINPFSLA